MLVNFITFRHYDKMQELRKKFEQHMEDELLQMQKDIVDDEIFLKIHTPLHRLCQEAENMRLEMPLKGVNSYS